MKRMLAVAAFLLVSSTAQAQYEFQYGGRTIRIDPDRGTVSIPGVYDNTGKKSKRAKDQDSSRKTQDAKVDPQAPPAPADTAPATATPAAPAAAPSPVAAAPAAPPPPPAPPPPATATTAPDPSTVPPPPAPTTETAALPPPPPPQPAPPAQQAAPPPPAPTVAAAPPVARPPAPAPVAIKDPNSPIGIWLTEEKEGKVRIEQCGPNLCGYSVDAKTNLNGEQVLINMKPNQGLKWSGRIHDPNTGSNYDSTIALKGDTLRVQGCAFGGMFCGGQTWSRVN
jgi:uncharacterized protein (DUF2147 family)